MIKEVDNYNYIKNCGVLDVPLAERLKFINTKMIMPEYQDYLYVLQHPELVEQENLLQSYADGTISKAKLKLQLGASLWNKYSKFISHIQDYRTTGISSMRQMKVVWVTGESGSGKSRLCRYLMIKKFGDGDFGVSGNDKHIFDSYDDQSGFILEEFRSSTMRLSTLLTALDNNNNSATEARYHNKDFSCCKLIAINSIRTPQESYIMFQDVSTGSSEPIKQLVRRLDYSYLYINKDGSIDSIRVDEYGQITGRVKTQLHMDTVNSFLESITPKSNLDLSDVLGEINYDF